MLPSDGGLNDALAQHRFAFARPDAHTTSAFSVPDAPGLLHVFIVAMNNARDPRILQA